MNREVWRELFETDLEHRGIFDVWNFSVEEDFEKRKGWLQYIQCCCARFRCSICGRYWASSKVHIYFQMKKKRRTGQVRMHVFKQKCKMCTAAEYEEPTFQVENIEIAIENLVNQIMQKFYNVPIQVVPRSCVSDGRHSGPHDYNNCQGCALGICKCKIDDLYYDKAAILPHGTSQGHKPKKKRFPHHQGAAQTQRSTYWYREASGTERRSDCTIDIPVDEQSDSCPCCIIL